MRNRAYVNSNVKAVTVALIKYSCQMGNVLLSDPCRADDKSVLGFYADDDVDLVQKIGEDRYID